MCDSNTLKENLITRKKSVKFSWTEIFNLICNSMELIIRTSE